MLCLPVRGNGGLGGLGGAAVRGSLVGEVFPGAHSISTGAKIDFATVGRSRPPGIRGPWRASDTLRHAIPPRARGETPYAAPMAIGFCNRANTPILLSHTVKGMVS